MIIEDYVSFETAKLLKDKGFNEDCWHWYEEDGYFKDSNDDYGFQSNSDHISDDFICSAPTLQMALKWLREIHHIIFVFKPSCFSGDECTYWTYELWCGDNFEGEILSFKNYEQAVEAALKHVLENLI